MFKKLESPDKNYLNIEEFYLLSTPRQEIFNRDNFVYLFEDIYQGEQQDQGGLHHLDVDFVRSLFTPEKSKSQNSQ